MTRTPILSFSQYRKDHIEFSSLTAEHLVSAWGEGKLSKQEIDRTLKRAIECSFAINMHSRIIHASAANDTLSELAARNPDCSFYAIDLVCRDFIFDIPEGRQFDVRKLKRWVKNLLPDVSYLGGIDLAYYYDGNLVPGKKPPFLSWHAHVIAWGIPEERLRKLKKLAEMQFSAGWEGAEVFHSKKWATDKIVGRAMYALKSAMSEYKVERTAETVDPATGVVRGGTIVQNKRPLRPASKLEIIRAIGDRKIDDLMIAGAGGKKVRRQILIKAWFQQRSAADAHHERRIGALGLPPTMLQKLAGVLTY